MRRTARRRHMAGLARWPILESPGCPMHRQMTCDTLHNERVGVSVQGIQSRKVGRRCILIHTFVYDWQKSASRKGCARLSGLGTSRRRSVPGTVLGRSLLVHWSSALCCATWLKSKARSSYLDKTGRERSPTRHRPRGRGQRDVAAGSEIEPGELDCSWAAEEVTGDDNSE